MTQLTPTVAFTEVLGRILRQRREAAEVQQAVLAEMLDLNASSLSRVESGLTTMSVVQLRRAAAAIGGGSSWEILRDAEWAADRIVRDSPGVRLVEERPRDPAAAAGWFLGGAAVGALLAGALAADLRRSGGPAGDRRRRTRG